MTLWGCSPLPWVKQPLLLGAAGGAEHAALQLSSVPAHSWGAWLTLPVQEGASIWRHRRDVPSLRGFLFCPLVNENYFTCTKEDCSIVLAFRDATFTFCLISLVNRIHPPLAALAESIAKLSSWSLASCLVRDTSDQGF